MAERNPAVGVAYDNSSQLSGSRIFYDKATGEVIKEEFAAFVTKRERQKNLRFTKLYTDNVLDVLTSEQLSIGAKAMLFHCITLIDWQSNYLVHPKTGERLGISALAEIIGHARQQVSKWLEELHEKGLVILEEGERGTSTQILLNMHIAFRGTKIRDITQVERSNKSGYKPKSEVILKEVEKIIRG